MNYKSIINLLSKKYFLNEHVSNLDSLKKLFIEWSLSFEEKLGSGVIMDDHRIDIETFTINDEAILDSNKLFDEIHPLFGNVQKTGHTNMLKNINPPPTTSSIVMNALTSTLLPNACTEEMAGNLALAEPILVKEMSKMLGLINSTMGFFTFGGTGTIFYSLFVSIKKIFLQFPKTQLNDIIVIAPKSAHEALRKSMMWQHLSSSSLVELPVRNDMSSKTELLEEVILSANSKNKKIAMIYCSFGSTSNFALDDVDLVCNISNKLKNSIGYKIHVHVDAVAGWIYAPFRNYNCETNDLDFSDEVINKIKIANQRQKGFSKADSFGIDFHKTGFTNYTSSMVLFNEDVRHILYDSKAEVPHLYSSEATYNPGKFTLETSRSASNIISTLVTLKSLGYNGLRALWGNAVQNGIFLEKEILKNKRKGFSLANSYRYGADVLLFAYPANILPDKEYLSSLEYNQYISGFYQYICSELEKKERKISIGYTRSSTYDETGKPIPGLRIYPLSLYFKYENAHLVIDNLIRLKLEYDIQIS